MSVSRSKPQDQAVLSLNRGLPFHIEAEQCVLGALLIDAFTATPHTVQYLELDDFHHKGHRVIFEACLNLHRNGGVIDIVTLSDALKDDERLRPLGGVSYLAALAEAVPTAANVRYYAKLLKRETERRKRILQAVDEVESAYSDQTIVPSKGFVPLGEVLEDVLMDVYMSHETGRYSGYATGFLSLDEYLGGFNPGELYIVAGRPSQGKSAFCAQVAAYVKSMGGRVMFFPLEVGKRQLAKNLAAMSTQTETWKLKKGMGYSHTTEESEALVAYAKAQREGLFLLSTRKTSKGINTAVREAISEKGGIDIVFIDHLQELLPEGDDRWTKRNYQLEGILQDLRQMARDYNIPIVLAAQVGRSSEGREPTIAEIKDSGSIEQIADVILIIHGEQRGSGNRNLIVAKHRNGPTGKVSLYLDGKYLRFEERI